MKRIITSVLMVVLIVFPALAVEPNYNIDHTNTYPISGHVFDGFEQCRVSKDLAELIKNLMSKGRPQNKEETAWTYAVRTEALGLPAIALQIGVCDASGERGCGWGSFLAVVIAKPMIDVKAQLEKQTGIDFTKEERDNEYQVTLRPVLARGKNLEESILYCDPGSL